MSPDDEDLLVVVEACLAALSEQPRMLLFDSGLWVEAADGRAAFFPEQARLRALAKRMCRRALSRAGRPV